MATINLTKVPKVNLSKGQTITLTKDGSDKTEKLNRVFFGAKWGSIVEIKEVTRYEGGFFARLFGTGKSHTEKKISYSESVDLDASLVCFDENKQYLETIYFGNKISKDRAIRHSGDDLHGTAGNEEENDNETITIDLPSIAKKTHYIIAILNSYSHQRFDEIPYMKLRIYTGTLGNPNEILCDYNIKNSEDFKNKQAIVLGGFIRTPNNWKFVADGTTSNEHNISSMIKGSVRNFINKL